MKEAANSGGLLCIQRMSPGDDVSSAGRPTTTAKPSEVHGRGGLRHRLVNGSDKTFAQILVSLYRDVERHITAADAIELVDVQLAIFKIAHVTLLLLRRGPSPLTCMVAGICPAVRLRRDGHHIGGPGRPA